MSISHQSAAVERALAESQEETEYATPYDLVCHSLRPQPAKTRAEVVELLVQAFGLHEFDAETVARSAADLAQLRDSIRVVRKRRYGQLEVTYLEFDVVTWRILPSIENVRFEGDRAWTPTSAARYESLGGGQPVLSLNVANPASLLKVLKDQTGAIWRTNQHSRSVPMRGIENSGLLSIARVKFGSDSRVGVLDSTDGFSRTVGAQRGSAIGVDDVLGELQIDAHENRLRVELIKLRDSGEADLDSVDGRVAASRLRCSVMPRAQVIVGYRWLDETAESKKEEGYAGARRQLVGHIHLEPPLKFTDSTQFALKARIALTALQEVSKLPEVKGYGSSDLVRLLLDGEHEDSGSSSRLKRDEVLLVAVDAIRGSSGPSGAAIAVGNVLSALTGKKPSRAERTLIAVDTAMRSNRLAEGESRAETDFAGRRSTMGRALAHSSFNSSKLTRQSVEDLLVKAIEQVRSAEMSTGAREMKVSAPAAELGALAVFALVDGVEEPLIVRSNSKSEDGSYLPEPPEIMQKMMVSEAGLNQLAQAVFDSRSGRRMTLVPEGETAVDGIRNDWETLASEHLIAFARGGLWNTSTGGRPDPRTRLDVLLSDIGAKSSDLRDTLIKASELENASGTAIVEAEGAFMKSEYKILANLAFVLRKWTETSEQINSAASLAHDEDTEFSEDDWEEDVELAKS